jgi:uncharacterized phage protein (TIGR01671 family)
MEYKFRAIDEFSDDFIYAPAFFVSPDNNQGYLAYDIGDHHCVKKETAGQFTGLKDKNGVEIFEGDMLRIKGKMGDKSEYSYDCIYEVGKIIFSGISIHFKSLTNKLPDSVDNSFPIHQTMSFYYDSLDSYDDNKLMIKRTHGENHLQHTKWIQHEKTKEIEVIGNIHQNPELLK